MSVWLDHIPDANCSGVKGVVECHGLFDNRASLHSGPSKGGY